MFIRFLTALAFFFASASAQINNPGLPSLGDGLNNPGTTNVGGSSGNDNPSTPSLDFGAANFQGNGLDVGSHSILQWERTQAWTDIEFVNIPTPPTTGGAAVIFTTSNQGNSVSIGNLFTGYEHWIDPNCHERVRVISNFGGNNYIGAIGTANVCGGLHKLAASYDGSSTFAGIKMWVDGVADTTTSEGTALSASIINNQKFLIGNQSGWGFGLGGRLSHFSLSNVVRNQAFIQAYTTAAGSADASTMLAYDFGENTGKTTADASANGFTASVDNVIWRPSGAVGRAPYIRNSAVGADTGATARTNTFATLPVTAAGGDIIAGSVYCACTTPIGITDDKGNAYTVVGPNTGKANVQYWLFYSGQVSNSPSVVTGTLTSSTGTFWRMVIDDIANAGVSDGSALAYTAACSTANCITSGAFTPSVNNDFIYTAATHYAVANLLTGTNFSLSVNTHDVAPIDDFTSAYFWQGTAASVAGTWSPSAAADGTAGAVAFKSNIAPFVPFALSFTDTANNATTQSTYTFAARALGTPDATRQIVVVASERQTSAITSTAISVQGIACTGITQANSGTNATSAAYICPVPTGTTGDVVVSWSAPVLRTAIAVYSVIGTGVAVGTPQTDITLTPSKSVTVTQPGGLIAVGVCIASATGSTPTNLTSDVSGVFTSTTDFEAAHNVTASGATTFAIGYSPACTVGQAAIFVPLH